MYKLLQSMCIIAFAGLLFVHDRVSCEVRESGKGETMLDDEISLAAADEATVVLRSFGARHKLGVSYLGACGQHGRLAWGMQRSSGRWLVYEEGDALERRWVELEIGAAVHDEDELQAELILSRGVHFIRAIHAGKGVNEEALGQFELCGDLTVPELLSGVAVYSQRMRAIRESSVDWDLLQEPESGSENENSPDELPGLKLSPKGSLPLHGEDALDCQFPHGDSFQFRTATLRRN